MDEKKFSYIQERCYVSSDETNENTEDKKFWIKILGKKLWRRLIHSVMFSGYLNEKVF